MSRTIQLDDRRLILLLLALDELETSAETALTAVACISDRASDNDIFFEHVQMLEDCKEFKAEICYLISSGR